MTYIHVVEHSVDALIHFLSNFMSGLPSQYGIMMQWKGSGLSKNSEVCKIQMYMCYLCLLFREIILLNENKTCLLNTTNAPGDSKAQIGYF